MGDRLIIFRNLTSFSYLSSYNALHNTNGNHIENLLKGQKLVMSLPAFSIVLLSVTQICWCMYIDPTTCKSWTYLDFNIVALECTFRPKSDYVFNGYKYPTTTVQKLTFNHSSTLSVFGQCIQNIQIKEGDIEVCRYINAPANAEIRVHDEICVSI